MKTTNRLIGGAVFALLASSVVTQDAQAAPPDLKDKVVLANPEKYEANLRFGTTRRNIKSGKASVLSPKAYPVTLEFWSGKQQIGWSKTQIKQAGVYVFRWQAGGWSLTRRTTKSRTTRQTSARSYRQSTGSYKRTTNSPTYIRRGPTYVQRAPTYRGRVIHPRWTFWCRGVWGLARLYEFIRDEEDRDIMRDIIIGREVDDAVRREIGDRWRDRLVALPLGERREIERAIDDLGRLSDEDWKDISMLPTGDWDRLQDEIDIDWDDKEWDGLGGWIDDIDSDWGVDDADLSELDITALDENIDLDNLSDIADTMDLEDGLDIEFGEDIDLGDVVGGADSMDWSDFGDGGFDGGVDLDDIDDGGLGGWGDGGFDIDPGDYDAGGFDDWGGGWDDGGGFDDFGGGFDDFGGGDFFDF